MKLKKGENLQHLLVHVRSYFIDRKASVTLDGSLLGSKSFRGTDTSITTQKSLKTLPCCQIPPKPNQL